MKNRNVRNSLSFLIFIVVLFSGIGFTVRADDGGFKDKLVGNNQFYGKVETAYSDRVITIGGGYPFNPGLPEMYSETPWGGIDYHYAVVFLTDSDHNVLDVIDLRSEVKAGSIVEAWYAGLSQTEPKSPVLGVTAMYYNPVSGLAVAVTK